MEPSSRESGNQRKRSTSSVVGAFLEVACEAKSITDMGETEHRPAAGARKGVEGCRLHLDSDDALSAPHLDGAACSLKGASVVQVTPRWTGSPHAARAGDSNSESPSGASTKGAGGR